MPNTRRKIHVRATLALILGLLFVPAIAWPQSPLQKSEQGTPKAQKPAPQSRETLVGILMRAEWKFMAQITIPFPPVTPRSAPGPTISEGQMQLVTPDKGMELLVLHFSVRPGKSCPVLDRQRLVITDKRDESYSFGGWGVDRAEYTYCDVSVPVMEKGMWGNVLWTPVGISPAYGFFDLVYQIEPGATELVFTDGINRIDLDPLILPKPKPKKK